MRQNSRTNRVASRDPLEIELEKWGAAWSSTPEEREDFAAFAERRGYTAVARRLRAANARRHGFVRPTLEAVPADGRRPLVSGNDRPLLRVLPGGDAPDDRPVDHAAVAWAHVARAAEHGLLTLALDPLDAADLRQLADAARNAAAPPPPQPA